MATPVSELQKINPSNIVELFQLQLDTTIHDANTTYYFHNGVNENNNSNLIFNNIEYTRMPIEATGFEFNGKQLPRPQITISNILGTFTTILLTLPQGLEGAKVTRIRTLQRYIDNTNFIGGEILLENGSNLLLENGSAIDMESGINPFGTPDPTATFPDEIYYIDRKITETRDIIQFELAASFDLQGVRLPKRQVLPADFPGVGTFFS
jgi:phage-related protein